MPRIYTDFLGGIPACLVLLVVAITFYPVCAQTTTINAGPTSVSADGAQYAISGTDAANPIMATINGNSVSATIRSAAGLPTVTISGDFLRVVQEAGTLQAAGVSPTLYLGGSSASVQATGGKIYANRGTVSLNMLGGTAFATGVGASGTPTYISGTSYEATVVLAGVPVTIDGSGNHIVLPKSNDNLQGVGNAARTRTLSVGGDHNTILFGAQYYGVAASNTRVAPVATVTGTSNTFIGGGGYIASISGVGNQATFLPDAAVDPRVFATLAGGALGYAYNAGSYVVNNGGTLIATTPNSFGFYANLYSRQLSTDSAFARVTVNSGGVAEVGGVATFGSPTPVTKTIGALISSGGTGRISNGAFATVFSGGYAQVASGAGNVVVSNGGTASLAPSAMVTGQEGAVIIAPDGYRVASTATTNGDFVYSAEMAASGMRNRKRKSLAFCAAPMELCPLGGGRLECIDTTTNLESCGGCWSTGEGQDCTMIVNADAVGCLKGRCVVKACTAGFKVDTEGTGCVVTA